MKIQIKHYCKVKGGKIVLTLPDLWKSQLEELEGKDCVIIIKKQHEKATISQYGYYRGGILPTCYKSEMFSALDGKDAVHDLYFAPKFLSYKVLGKINGKDTEQTLVRSLADLSVDEMSQFIERVLAECAELGLEIPPPEMFYNKYYTK